MKKSLFIILFFSILLSSCAGTKYKNQQTPSQRPSSSNSSASVNKPEKKSEETKSTKWNDASEAENAPDNTVSSALVDDVVTTAVNNVGTRYRYGGTDKSTGFDCSGLVYTSFKKYDISLPRSSYDMANFGLRISDSEITRGDLVFFITNGGKRINHVGIVTEVNGNEIKFVHSSTKLGVIISSTSEPYYKRNYVKAVRVL